MINRLKLWSRQYSLSLSLSLSLSRYHSEAGGAYQWFRPLSSYVLCDHSSDLRAANHLLQLLLIGFKFCCVHETAPLWLVPQNYSRCLTLYFHFKYKWRTVLFKPRQQLQDQAQITNARSVTGRLILFSQYASAYVAFLAKNQKCILTRWCGCRKYCNVSILVSEFLGKLY